MMQERLRSRIKELGWSVRETSRRTGVHHDMLHKLISGRHTDLRLSTLRKLCDGLSMSLDELAGCKTGKGEA